MAPLLAPCVGVVTHASPQASSNGLVCVIRALQALSSRLALSTVHAYKKLWHQVIELLKSYLAWLSGIGMPGSSDAAVAVSNLASKLSALGTSLSARLSAPARPTQIL